MYNTKTIELEKQIIDAINDSNIHICTVKYILEKILRMTNDTLASEIKKEKEALENAQKHD